MITNSPFIQLGMVVLAVSIFLLYIKPTITDIRLTQDQVGVYQGELDRVNEVNNLLQKHVNDINLLPLSDVQALERYVPAVIDEIAVMRDLLLITDMVGVTVTALDYTAAQGESVAAEDTESAEDGAGSQGVGGVSAEFNLAVSASYDEFKELLRALEINGYRLTVESANVTPDTEGQLSVDLTLLVQALGAPVTPSEDEVIPDVDLE